MAKRSGAGALNQRIQFEVRTDSIDDYGNVTPGAGPWVAQYECAARLQPLYGGRLNVEAVTAARLSAKQPYNLTVRNCAAARSVRTDWRVVDARQAQDTSGAAPRVFNITTIVNPDEKGAMLEMMVIEGEAS